MNTVELNHLVSNAYLKLLHRPIEYKMPAEKFDETRSFHSQMFLCRQIHFHFAVGYVLPDQEAFQEAFHNLNEVASNLLHHPIRPLRQKKYYYPFHIKIQPSYTIVMKEANKEEREGYNIVRHYIHEI